VTHRFSPEAQDDLSDAVEYYEGQRRGLGLRFAVEVGLGIAAIIDAPGQWPEIRPGFRKYRLANFPYALIYPVGSGNVIEILAVFDMRRRPDSWRR
jgi:plasmid stabilization system protein ParE